MWTQLQLWSVCKTPWMPGIQAIWGRKHPLQIVHCGLIPSPGFCCILYQKWGESLIMCVMTYYILCGLHNRIIATHAVFERLTVQRQSCLVDCLRAWCRPLWQEEATVNNYESWQQLLHEHGPTRSPGFHLG